MASLADIFKDAKAYVVAGFVLMATWSGLAPSYVEHQKIPQLVRGLAAYLLLRDALVNRDQNLYVAVASDETLPVTTGDFTENLDKDGISECDAGNTDQGKVTMPIDRHVYALTCQQLSVISPEQGHPRIQLSFHRIDIPRSDYVRAYFRVTAGNTLLPFKLYGVVLTRDGDGEDASYGERIEQRQAAFTKEYRFHVIQNRYASDFMYEGGDDEPTISDSLEILLSRNSSEAVQAREPPGWLQLRELMLESGLDAQDAGQVETGSPAVQTLFAQYLRDQDDEMHSVAGFTVTIHRVPLAISALLLVLSCLLVVRLPAARAGGPGLSGRGILRSFQQRYRRFGTVPTVASTILVLLSVVFSGYVIVVSLEIFREVSVASNLSLLVLILLMAVFAVLSIFTLLRQWPLVASSEDGETHKD